jgi:hypothetical protein
MHKLFFSAIVIAALLTVSCTSTFRVSKNGKGYFLGSNAKDLYKWLCESRDLEKILSETRLRQEKKGDLYKYNCSGKKSTLKVKEIYASMTPEERKDLRTAFKENGYDINAMTC